MRPSAWRTAWKLLRLIWPAPGIALHRMTARAASVRTEIDPAAGGVEAREEGGDAGRPIGQPGHAGVARAGVGGAEGEMAVGVDEDLPVRGAEEGEGEPEPDRARVVVAEVERRARGLEGGSPAGTLSYPPAAGVSRRPPPSRSRGTADHEVAAVLDHGHIVDVQVVCRGRPPSGARARAERVGGHQLALQAGARPAPGGLRCRRRRGTDGEESKQEVSA